MSSPARAASSVTTTSRTCAKSRDKARRIAANIAKLPELLRGSPQIKRGVTRLQPHISRQSAQCPLRPQVRKYRRNALSDFMGHKRSSPFRLPA